MIAAPPVMTPPVPPALARDRAYPARPILAASIAVFRADRVLLARRARPPGAGRFSLPGGLVEVGESLEAAALRELHEEVGVEACVLGFNRHVEVVERDGEGRVSAHFVVASFIGRWVSGEGEIGPEASEIAWAARADLESLPTTDQLPPLLEAAWRRIATMGAPLPPVPSEG